MRDGATYDDGYCGRAFRFNGAGAYLFLPDDASDVFSLAPGESISIEFWLNSDDFTRQYGTHILGSRHGCGGGNSFNYQLVVYNDYRLTWGRVGSATGSVAGSVSDGEWRHIVAVYDGVAQEWRQYLDGTLLSRLPGTPGPEVGIGLYIAASGYCGLRFQGRVDEIYVYSRALSDGEVSSIYRCYTNPTISVDIDVKPSSARNPLNMKSKGVIPVAILSSTSFDAVAIDPNSVKFGPGDATEAHMMGHVEDVNGDGLDDLMLHFDTQSTGITCDMDEVSLTGETFGGDAIEGSDTIDPFNCP